MVNYARRREADGVEGEGVRGDAEEAVVDERERDRSRMPSFRIWQSIVSLVSRTSRLRSLAYSYRSSILLV